jgi:hypothetical protein
MDCELLNGPRRGVVQGLAGVLRHVSGGVCGVRDFFPLRGELDFSLQLYIRTVGSVYFLLLVYFKKLLN